MKKVVLFISVVLLGMSAMAGAYSEYHTVRASDCSDPWGISYPQVNKRVMSSWIKFKVNVDALSWDNGTYSGGSVSILSHVTGQSTTPDHYQRIFANASDGSYQNEWKTYTHTYASANRKDFSFRAGGIATGSAKVIMSIYVSFDGTFVP